MAIYDYDASLGRMGGNQQLFLEMVQFLEADGPEHLQQVQAGMERGDAKSVHRHAHSLKGLVANFDAERTAQAALAVEERAKAGQLPAAPLVEELQLSLTELLATLSADVKKMQGPG